MDNSVKNILIVEDDEKWLQTLCQDLEKAGFKVSCASNGKAALEICFREYPDFILLDLVMPGMHGFEVLKILRSDDRSRKIPVMILTNYPDYPGIEGLIHDMDYEIMSKANGNITKIIGRINDKLNRQKS